MRDWILLFVAGVLGVFASAAFIAERGRTVHAQSLASPPQMWKIAGANDVDI